MALLKKKLNFYTLDHIKKFHAKYNMVFGERSNGKTYSVLNEILENYLHTGKKGAVIRRWADDFKQNRGKTMFNALISNNMLNGTKWDGVDFKNGAWILYTYDGIGDKKIYDKDAFCYSFSLSSMEHDKSTSYPDVTTVLFDEFLSRRNYLPDEFMLFMNVLSTIIRERNDVVIYMMGNTVTYSCPYFTEMGIKNVKKMKQGDIDIYSYGESGLTVAVEYADGVSKAGKPSDVYFAFDNPKLNMITGGAWELAIYPHLPCGYKQQDVYSRMFIYYLEEWLQIEFIQFVEHGVNCKFAFVHRKTTPIKDEYHDIIFTPEPSYLPNYHTRINDGCREGMLLLALLKIDKVFYADNEIGEILRNYLIFCKRYSIIKE